MADERNQFSSTMRIDIPPDLLGGGDQQKLKGETTGIHKPRQTGKVSRKDKSASKSLFSQLLQSIYDGCLISDPDGMIVDANTRVLEFIKRELDDVKGLRVAHLISGADEALIPSIRESLENDRFVLIQAYVNRSDGSIFPAEISVNSLDGDERRLCFFIRDITVRKETEEMLRTGYNAIQNSANGIAVADLAGKLYYVNPAIVSLWGYTRGDDLMGKHVTDLWKDKAAAEAMFRLILEKQDIWNGELMARVAGGAEVPMQVSAARNRDADEEIVGVVFSFVDMRDRKRAEEAMRQAEGQKAMLASLAAACHHLGQPSTVIVANLALLERMMKDASPELRELLGASNQACEELSQILYRLNTIDVYKPQTYLQNAQDKDAPENKIIEI